MKYTEERKITKEITMEEYDKLCEQGIIFQFEEAGEEFKKVYAEYCKRFDRLFFLEGSFCYNYGTVCGIESEIVQELKKCLATGCELNFDDIAHSVIWPDGIVL